MSERPLLLKIPVLREETFDCMPRVSFPYVASGARLRHWSDLFFVDEARNMNFELLGHIDSSTDLEEAEAVRSLLSAKKPRVEQVEKVSSLRFKLSLFRDADLLERYRTLQLSTSGSIATTSASCVGE